MNKYSTFLIYAENILSRSKVEKLTEGSEFLWRLRIQGAALAIHDAIKCKNKYHLKGPALNTFEDMFSLNFLLYISRHKFIPNKDKKNIVNYVINIPGVYLDNQHNQNTNSIAIDQHAYASLIIIKNTKHEWNSIVAEVEREELSNIFPQNIVAKNKNIERI